MQQELTAPASSIACEAGLCCNSLFPSTTRFRWHLWLLMTANLPLQSKEASLFKDVIEPAQLCRFRLVVDLCPSILQCKRGSKLQ